CTSMTVTFSYRTELGLAQRQVSETDLAAAERQLGIRLPDDFRAFLLAHDGPTPSPGWLRLETKEGPLWCGPIHYFLSTSHPPVKRTGPRSACLEYLTLASRDGERLPADYVVIAQLATQPSTLLLSVAAADYGTIYAWRVSSKRFRPDQITRVAASF